MSTSKIKTDNPIKKIMDTTLTKKTAALYVRNWKYIEAYFDPKVLTQAVRKFKVRDFATFEYVQTDNHYQYKHYIEAGYPLITPKPVSSYVTEYSNHNGGGWERRVSKLCYEFIVPDKYQLREKDLLMEALLIEFPYLANYSIQAYHMENGCTRKQIEEFKKSRSPSYFSSGINNYFGEDLYIKPKNKKVQSIYVPYLALKEKNPEIAIMRHNSYHISYFSGTKREEMLHKAIGVLEEPWAKKLFKHIKAGK